MNASSGTMQRERQVHRDRERKKDADSRGEIYFEIGDSRGARRHARTNACMHAFIRHACSTMHTLVRRAAQTIAQNHALWRCALWAGKLWHRVRAAAHFRFPPYPDSIPLPSTCPSSFTPHTQWCSGFGDRRGELESGSDQLARFLSLFLPPSPYRRRQIREEIWFVKYNSHERRWARDESSKAIVSGSWLPLVLFYLYKMKIWCTKW